MEFVITKTSDSTPQVKTFNTLQDLINFFEQCDEELVLSKNFWYNISASSCAKAYSISKEFAAKVVKIKYEIEIYDDYRE